MVKLTETGEMPESICYMPAGESVICAMVNGEPEERRVVADEGAAKRLQADLAAMLAESAKQLRARPCLYFDHERGEAAAYPRKFYWDPEQGIMLEIAEWSAAGRAAVEGKTYGYISPSFRLSRADGQVMGLNMDGVEVASLVNDPAFSTQPPIVDVAASRGVLEDGVDYINAESGEPEKIFSPRNGVEPSAEAPHNGDRNEPTAMDLEKLKQMLGLPAEADETAVEQAIAALLAAKEDASKKADELQASSEEQDEKLKEKDEALQKKDEELKEKDEELEAARAAAAEAFTDSLIRTGKLAPKDEERIKACRALYTANPKQAKLALAYDAVTVGESVLASRPEASHKEVTLAEMLAPDFA